MASAFICEESPRTLVCRVCSTAFEHFPKPSGRYPHRCVSCVEEAKRHSAEWHRQVARKKADKAERSKAHALRLENAIKRRPRTCHACEKTFYRTGSNGPKSRDAGKFCSRDCAYEWKAFIANNKEPARFVVLMKPARFRQCKHCTTAIRVGTTRKQSCDPCREKAKLVARRKAKEYARVTGLKAAKRKARKLRVRGVKVETVNPLVVLRRDKWRCQLCGDKTPERLRGSYDERAPEIDHIIPISQGGEHSYRNVQCACRRCNIAKSSTPRGQMRLFG